MDQGFPENLSDFGISTQWPFLNVLIKVPFYAVFHGTGMYALCGSLFLFFSILRLCRALGGRAAPAAVYTVALTPFVWNYSLFHSSDTLVAGLLLYSFSGLLRAPGGPSRPWPMAVTSALMGSLRYNALPLSAAFLAMAAAIRKTLKRSLWFLGGGGLIFGVLVMGPVLLARSARGLDIAAHGYALHLWEIGHRVEDAEIRETLARFIRDPGLPLDESCLDVGMWCGQYQDQVIYSRLFQTDLRSRYLRALVRHPAASFSSFLRFSAYMLGLRSPLPETEIGKKDSAVPFESIRMKEDAWRIRALDWHRRSIAFLGGLAGRQLLLLVLAVPGLKAIGRSWKEALALSVACGLYWIPLIAVASSRDFRYFFPTTLLCYTVIICSVAHGLALVRARRM